VENHPALRSASTEAELILEEFNANALCHYCLHPVANHLHGMLACCRIVRTQRPMTLFFEDGTTAEGIMETQELCDCEALR
jgi:hypothetical protein